jgi:quinol monooxygenase YgiN
MVTVFIRHRVKNYPKWKKVYDACLPIRRAGGEISYIVGHVSKKTNNICVILQWDSPANVAKFLKSKELKKAMKDSGVIEKPDVFIVEEKERGNTK